MLVVLTTRFDELHLNVLGAVMMCVDAPAPTILAPTTANEPLDSPPLVVQMPSVGVTASARSGTASTPAARAASTKHRRVIGSPRSSRRPPRASQTRHPRAGGGA